MTNFFIKLKRIKVMFQCGLLFGWDCFKLSIEALLGKDNRLKTNQSLHRGSINLLNAVNSKYKITQPKNFSLDKSKPRIYMSNHLSLFDTPLFYATIDDTIRIVTKIELLKVPLVGRAILKSEHPVVDRFNREKHEDFYKDAKKKLNDGIALWFFPEGKRSITGELLPFKMGGFRLAAELGAQIIPVGIIGTNRILPMGKLIPFLDEPTEIHLGEPIDAGKFNTPELQQILLTKVHEEVLRLSAATKAQPANASKVLLPS
ncbi:MAG: lysophospholipid acyltransferase family protein [Gammaproteobacteria bacterium]